MRREERVRRYDVYYVNFAPLRSPPDGSVRSGLVEDSPGSHWIEHDRAACVNAARTKFVDTGVSERFSIISATFRATIFQVDKRAWTRPRGSGPVDAPLRSSFSRPSLHDSDLAAAGKHNRRRWIPWQVNEAVNAGVSDWKVCANPASDFQSTLPYNVGGLDLESADRCPD